MSYQFVNNHKWIVVGKYMYHSVVYLKLTFGLVTAKGYYVH